MATRTMKWLMVALVVGVGFGCGPSRTASEASRDLAASDSQVRLKAARDIEAVIRGEGSLPAAVVDALLERAPIEKDFKTRASILIALGATGDERAKSMLDEYAQTQDRQQRIYATRALRKYAMKTGKMSQDSFSETWPYGTEGYPAPLPK